MSMMICSSCDALIDTDENVEGIFEDASPFRYFCSNCVDYQNPAAMAVIREQDPTLYKELTDE